MTVADKLVALVLANGGTVTTSQAIGGVRGLHRAGLDALVAGDARLVLVRARQGWRVERSEATARGLAEVLTSFPRGC